MVMSAARADATLEDALDTPATPFLQLHIGNPGANGTANIAQLATDPAVRKAAAFGAVANHATNDERVKLSNAQVAWTGTEIDASQEITHFSLWSAVTAGQVEFIDVVGTPKTTGSDGVIIESGDIEVALSVFAKPA
jgi:hypothetical protein